MRRKCKINDKRSDRGKEKRRKKEVVMMIMRRNKKRRSRKRGKRGGRGEEEGKRRRRRRRGRRGGEKRRRRRRKGGEGGREGAEEEEEEVVMAAGPGGVPALRPLQDIIISRIISRHYMRVVGLALVFILFGFIFQCIFQGLVTIALYCTSFLFLYGDWYDYFYVLCLFGKIVVIAIACISHFITIIITVFCYF